MSPRKISGIRRQRRCGRGSSSLFYVSAGTPQSHRRETVASGFSKTLLFVPCARKRLIRPRIIFTFEITGEGVKQHAPGANMIISRRAGGKKMAFPLAFSGREDSHVTPMLRKYCFHRAPRGGRKCFKDVQRCGTCFFF